MSLRDARTIMADIAALGLSAEAMALMMELTASLASNVQPAAPARSKAALRTERWRENKRLKASQNVTGDATVTIGDAETSHVTLGDAGDGATPPLPPPPPSFPQTPNQPPPPPAPPCGPDAPVREDRETDLFGGDENDGAKPAKPKGGRKTPTSDEEPFVLPDDIPADAWAGFEEMRIRMRKPMTDRARRGIVKRLRMFAEDGHPPGDVLDQSTTNSWIDVYKLKDEGNGTGNRGSAGGQFRSGFRDPVLADIAGIPRT